MGTGPGLSAPVGVDSFNLPVLTRKVNDDAISPCLRPENFTSVFENAKDISFAFPNHEPRQWLLLWAQRVAPPLG